MPATVAHVRRGLPAEAHYAAHCVRSQSFDVSEGV